jgi:hypothetical protein
MVVLERLRRATGQRHRGPRATHLRRPRHRPGVFDHVRRIGQPVINSPKGQTARLPPDLVQRPVVAPAIYWTWSLVCRVGEARAAALAVVDALCDGIADLGVHGPGAWLPGGDPHRQ